MNKVSFYVDGNIEIIAGVGMHKFPYHTHNSFLVGAVLEGYGEFRIGDKLSTLHKGECYIVPSDVGIAIKPISDFSYITICLKNELAAIMKDYKSDSYFYSGLSNKLLELTTSLRMHNVDEQFLAVHIADMFELYKVYNSTRLKCTEKAVQYINNHFQSKFSLDELAKNCFMSKYHLIRTFKKEMGITPKQYHQQCKVRKLKDMIFDDSQSNIAYMLNFSTQSHMDSIFKKYMGITLGSYISAVEIIKQ
ncbi:MAG: helix-turn-helix transcriptional regulator [Lachnospiraceae bacterium]|nr:helix-turn-helix transcriptional regulator [Lachnospiraceae bacterium]